MNNKTYSDTNFTIQVKNLLARTYGRSQVKDSVLDRAIEYYEKQPLIEHKLTELKVNIEKISAQSPTDKTKQQLIRLEREQRNFQEELRFERNERHQHLFSLCQEIINLCEGETFAESNRKSAQVLGTIQLVSPTEGKKIALLNEQHKPLYKSILCLRLLDRLCLDKNIAEPYIKLALADVTPEKYQSFAIDNPEAYKIFVEQVKISYLPVGLLCKSGGRGAKGPTPKFASARRSG